MEKYILNPNIALRSWRLVPYAYYIRHERNARGLKKEEFEFLSACDGLNGQDGASPFAQKFLACGMIHEAKNGETLSEWQRPLVCDNRYFPAMNVGVFVCGGEETA